LAYEYQPRSTLRTVDFIRLVETKRIADPTSSDVRVMTIHQAKGLQFDVVFLPELNTPLAGLREMFVAARPGPTQPVNVVCRLANEQVRQFFPPALRKLFEDDFCREVSEALCVLYVAMTRAVHVLHMIISPAKENEQNLPKTYAGLLRATLAADKPADGGKTLYQTGIQQWSASRQLQPPEPSVDTSARRIGRCEQIQLAAPLLTRERGLERISPSALEGGTRLPASRLLAPRIEESLNLGTLFHAWLEQIKWLDEAPPSNLTLRQIAANLCGQIGDVANLDELIARIRRQLAAPTISAVLQRSFYRTPANLSLAGLAISNWPTDDVEVTVHCERRFAIRHASELLTGTMDRLVRIHSGGRTIAADLVDFKTDDIPPDDQTVLMERVAFYRPQVDAYRSAAARLLKVDPSRLAARLVFLSRGIVVSI